MSLRLDRPWPRPTLLRMKNVIALFAGLALMACNPPDKPDEPAAPDEQAAATPATPPAADPAPAPVTPDPAADTCNKAQYAALVGKPATDPGVPPASRDVRHIRPDTQVTMDYRPDRLNIIIDDKGVITELKCT